METLPGEIASQALDALVEVTSFVLNVFEEIEVLEPFTN